MCFQLCRSRLGILRFKILYWNISLNFVVLTIFQQNINCRYIIIAVIAWSVAELIRYPYYIISDTHFLSFLAPLFKWLRLSGFIVLYPIGASGELLSLYDSWNILLEKRPYNLEMPNRFNFAFNVVYAYYGFIVLLIWPSRNFEFPACKLYYIFLLFQLFFMILYREI